MGEKMGGEDMGMVGQEDDGCSQVPELSPRQSERLRWKRMNSRKQQVEEMAGGREGDHVGEEKKHIEQFDSFLKPTKVFRPKRGKGRQRKIQVEQGLMHKEQGEWENAGNNEEILLNQGLHQRPKNSTELLPSSKRPRKGKDVTGSREEEEVSQTKTDLRMVLSKGIYSPQVAIALECRRITRSLKAYLDQSPERSALLKSPVQHVKNTYADMHDHLTTTGDISALKSSSGYVKEWGISAAEIAFASESRCLTQNMKAYLDRCPSRATPLRSPVRNVMTSATNEQNHSATMHDIPAAVSSSAHVKNQSLSFSPTSLMCHDLPTTALPCETDNQNASNLTNLGDQSMSADHGLLDTNEHAADLLTQNHGSGDLCQANPSDTEFIVDNHQSVEAQIPANVTINTEIEIASKIKKSGARPSRSVSLNLSHMCLLLDDDLADFDEVGSRLDEALVSVNGYEVKAEVAPILRDIFFRHGDIAKDCTFRAVKSRSCLLENVCGIYKRLEGANFMLITPIEINLLLEEVKDLENAKIELGWLHYRLIEILEAKKGFKSLKEEKGRITEASERGKQVLEGYKKELEGLMKKIHEKESALTELEVEEEKLHEKFNNMKSNMKGFYRKSLVHGLL